MTKEQNNKLVAALTAIGVIVAALLLRGPHSETKPQPPAQQEVASSTVAPKPATPVAPNAGRIVKNQKIYGLNGKLVYQGDIDLNPTFDRIAAGVRDPHRDDGTVFGNREHQLPRQPNGYYHEYVVRTAGISGPGPQRLVIGGTEAYYTPDHYGTFIKIQ